MMNQREFISKFTDEHRDRFNPVFFERNEDEIVTQLLNVIKSCERNKKQGTCYHPIVNVELKRDERT